MLFFIARLQDTAYLVRTMYFQNFVDLTHLNVARKFPNTIAITGIMKD